MPGKIRQRFVIALLAVAAVPLLGLGGYSIRSNTAALRELALAGARERARLRARKVEEMLRDIRGDLLFMARSPVLFDLLDGSGGGVDFWRAKLGQAFLALSGNKRFYACLRYLDAGGSEVVRVENDGLRSWQVPTERLENRGASGYFAAALRLGDGEVHVAAGGRAENGSGARVVRYALRAVDRQGRPRGVLVADVSADLIVGGAAIAGESGRVLLLGAEGPLLASGEAGGAEWGDAGQARRRLLQGAAAVVEEGEEYTVTWTAVWPAATGVPPLWLLAEKMPRAAVFASLERFRQVFALLVAAIVGAALLLSFFLARRIVGPLAELRRGTRRIADGDLEHRLRLETGDEIQEVAEEFNRMARALNATYRRLQRRDAAKSEELEKINRELAESQKLAAVGQLAAGVAHEINNPAGVVSMFAQQLQEREGIEPALRDKLRLIERHAERIGRVTRGLLDFARERDYKRERIDLDRALDAALAAWRPRLEAAGVAVDWRRDGLEEGMGVIGDEERLQQIFANLLLNALQAMPGGGRLEIDLKNEGGQVRLAFADSGPGIPPEYLERVFEPFFTTKEVGQGTGLGLAVSYGIAQAHGGRLRAENRPQGGARLVLELPTEPVAHPVGERV